MTNTQAIDIAAFELHLQKKYKPEVIERYRKMAALHPELSPVAIVTYVIGSNPDRRGSSAYVRFSSVPVRLDYEGAPESLEQLNSLYGSS